MDYTHPCHVGCKYSVDKEWAWQHFSDFDHEEDLQLKHPQLLHSHQTRGGGLDTRTSTTADDAGSAASSQVLLSGWKYLTDAGGGVGAANGGGGGAASSSSGSSTGSSSTWASPSTSSPAAAAPGGTGVEGQLEGSLGGSLFSADFFQPFPPKASERATAGPRGSVEGAKNGPGLANLDQIADVLQQVTTGRMEQSAHPNRYHRPQNLHGYQRGQAHHARAHPHQAQQLQHHQQHHHHHPQYHQQPQRGYQPSPGILAPLRDPLAYQPHHLDQQHQHAYLQLQSVPVSRMAGSGGGENEQSIAGGVVSSSGRMAHASASRPTQAMQSSWQPSG